MSTLRFTAIPLTPIHIGNGDVLAPEDYLLDGDILMRFNRKAVVRDMRPSVRWELEAALDRNNFTKVQEFIRSACDPRCHVLSRIGISDASRGDLQMLIKSPESPARKREVHPFIYNPLNGKPYVPGSSIKSAIRTALVNHFTQQQLPGVQQAVNSSHKDHRTTILETKALNFQIGKLEGDPLRLLKVADAELPEGCTQIDRAMHVQRGKHPTDIQLHYERLLSRGDDKEISFTVELDLDEKVSRHSQVKALLGRELSFDLIRQSCNEFYTGRMFAEHRRFFSNDRTPEARYGAQGLVQFRSNKLLIGKSVRDSGMLLRLGRFSHFESLSVDELREGWNIKKKQPINEGSSRTLCRRAGVVGLEPMPFGWLLLRPL